MLPNFCILGCGGVPFKWLLPEPSRTRGLFSALEHRPFLFPPPSLHSRPLGLGVLGRGSVRSSMYFYAVTDAGPANHRVRLWQGGPCVHNSGWLAVYCTTPLVFVPFKFVYGDTLKFASAPGPFKKSRGNGNGGRFVRSPCLPSWRGLRLYAVHQMLSLGPCAVTAHGAPGHNRWGGGDATPCEDTREERGLFFNFPPPRVVAGWLSSVTRLAPERAKSQAPANAQGLLWLWRPRVGPAPGGALKQRGVTTRKLQVHRRGVTTRKQQVHRRGVTTRKRQVHRRGVTTRKRQVHQRGVTARNDETGGTSVRLGVRTPESGGRLPTEEQTCGHPPPGDQPQNWRATGPRNGGHQPKNWTGTALFINLDRSLACYCLWSFSVSEVAGVGRSTPSTSTSACCFGFLLVLSRVVRCGLCSRPFLPCSRHPRSLTVRSLWVSCRGALLWDVRERRRMQVVWTEHTQKQLPIAEDVSSALSCAGYVRLALPLLSVLAGLHRRYDWCATCLASYAVDVWYGIAVQESCSHCATTFRLVVQRTYWLATTHQAGLRPHVASRLNRSKHCVFFYVALRDVRIEWLPQEIRTPLGSSGLDRGVFDSFRPSWEAPSCPSICSAQFVEHDVHMWYQWDAPHVRDRGGRRDHRKH